MVIVKLDPSADCQCSINQPFSAIPRPFTPWGAWLMADRQFLASGGLCRAEAALAAKAGRLKSTRESFGRNFSSLERDYSKSVRSVRGNVSILVKFFS